MSVNDTTRRKFLQTSTESIAAVTTGLACMSRLPRVSAHDARLQPDLVRLDDQIEPLVRLIEESPREKLLERIGEVIRTGRSYREILAALLLAGIRNVQPRPSVGFKFHCVLVVNACHLASLSGPDEDRWLPIFWALDYFKSSQADEARRTGWRMPPVNESLIPDAIHARRMFIDAMDHWDVEKADTATAGLVRSAGATEVFNLFATYAARDYRSIGHKVIFLANAWRTLQVIGWKFAEPVMRSLAFAMLNHNGEPNPSKSDLDVDRPWRENAELIQSIPKDWIDGKRDDGLGTDLCSAFRKQTAKDATAIAVDGLSNGIGPQSVWDGVFAGSGELLMRQPGIIGLHGLTTANAMHFVWRHVRDDRLRRQLLLQACSFNPMFRQSAKDRGPLANHSVKSLQPIECDHSGTEAIEEIMAEISKNRMLAAQKSLGFLTSGGNPHELISAARRLLFSKGRDAHDYKYSSAVLEDFGHVGPAWRERFLAMSVFNLKGSGDRDSGLLTRTQAALKG